ncbi:MAG TPA: ATP-binding protein [Candidatus Omnitrophota bacterium]|nr:ATP-binding protein [Candidatus Omnitrophota bacterium]
MKKLSNIGVKINSRIGKAIHDYKLIEEGDKILVGVSGGKDSLTLLKFLKDIQGWAPVKFDIIAYHVLTDIQSEPEEHEKFLREVFETIGVKYKIKKIKIPDDKKVKSGCFWCAWNRRKTLFKAADKLGCNKVALGHHKDDIVETMLMNLFYNGEISAMNPRQELFGGEVIIIRPLCYVEEEMTAKFSKENGFYGRTCQCRLAGDSKRKFVKDLIREVERSNPKINVKSNIFRSVSRIREGYIDLKNG